MLREIRPNFSHRDASALQSLRNSGRRVRNGFSWSGRERNHLFLNLHGEQFYDVAGISGLDHPGDSRSFVFWDYDRDGWQDIAVVNANTPLLQLFRNQIGRQAAGSGKGQIVALRFVGGNQTAEPSTDFSNRDGYGVLVTVMLGDVTLTREHRAGDGLAAQNSATMLIGIGKRTDADSIVIRWPSGVVQETRNVPAGTLVTVHENPSHSPIGETFVFQPYQIPAQRLERSDEKDSTPTVSRKKLLPGHTTQSKSRLRMYTTMATWCAACKRELPQLQRLGTLFTHEALAMYGIPIDAADSPDKLSAYVEKYHPAYELLTDLTDSQVAEIQAFIRESLKLDGLSATIVTDADGYVLKTMWGVPSASEIRQLLAHLDS